MNIYGSLMDIFDEKNKDIYVETKQRHLCRNKTKTFMTKHCFTRQPNPERGLFMDIQKNNL